MSNLANPEATARRLAAFPSVAARALGSTGLTVSQAGFGCYRIDPRVNEHRLALKQALMSGINLIDTSSNYADGGSETLVGLVLDELIQDDALTRDEVVVVTKAGYVQGANYVESQERKNQDQPWPDLVEYAPNLEYCIHPEFLAAQLGASLERLNLKAVDVYLLHNPEYYLGWAAQKGLAINEAREEYHRRLEAAFRHLEEEVQAGRIAFYGVSSNTFPAPMDYEEFTSLAALWHIAEHISKEHHFRVIQLPLNLLETGAVTLPNQPEAKGVLAFAHERGLGVLTNRPLNALGPKGLFRLALSGTRGAPPNEAEIIEAIRELLKSEDQLKLSLLPNLRLTPEEHHQISDYLGVAGVLARSWQDLSGLEHWRQMEQYLTSRLNAAFAFLARRLAESPEGLSALDAHLKKAKTALEGVLMHYLVRAERQARALMESVLQLDPDWRDAASLSRLAVRAVRSTQGVSSVLIGMRQRAYVEDVLAELAAPLEAKPRLKSWSALSEIKLADPEN
jgi:aryl-alcohol dehydrogenase-like predicted oxidoreductase